MFLGDVGEEQEGTCLLVFNPQRVVVLHQSTGKDTVETLFLHATKKSMLFSFMVPIKSRKVKIIQLKQ